MAPLKDLVADLSGGPCLPARAVVITFDDGWVTQYQNALPILRLPCRQIAAGLPIEPARTEGRAQSNQPARSASGGGQAA